MTACFVGSDRAEAIERVRGFLDLGADGDHPDPEEVFRERRNRWLAGTVEDVIERIEELRTIGVDRVFLQHLNHSDDAMVELVGDRVVPALR
jgi:alkanesulfonate monooxygenase SsuD/methylene tetrahydromethanopterin reductase-like flavin-dependent oxidoreductase (luciferase family)